MTAYDAIADWYDDWVSPGPLDEDRVFQSVEALMGNVGGLRIRDLACGQGRVARYLAERGASVVGIDSSVRLLELARAYEVDQAGSGVEYRLADARTLHGLEYAAMRSAVAPNCR